MNFVVILSALLIVYSSTVQLVPAFNALYVPIGLVATASLWLWARRVGLTADDVGLDPSTRRTGLIAGGIVAATAGVALTIAGATPALRSLFEDARLADIGPGLIAYRALIRIPEGTALLEEFAFRGVLLAAWRRVSGKMWAAIGSSVVFGFWHVRPALDLLDANELATGTMSRLLFVSGAVAGTTIAGLFFAWLRLRTESLYAPFLAHASINSVALVVAAVATG